MMPSTDVKVLLNALQNKIIDILQNGNNVCVAEIHVT